MIVYFVGELCSIALSFSVGRRVKKKGTFKRWCFEGGWWRSKVVRIESWEGIGKRRGSGEGVG